LTQAHSSSCTSKYDKHGLVKEYEYSKAIMKLFPYISYAEMVYQARAPVTRAFVIKSAALFTVYFFGIRGRGSSKLGLSYQDIFEKFRIWKLIKSNFAFSSTPELLFGVYLLYYFLYLFILFVDTTANLLTSGPYALVFAYFVPFYLDIPVSKRFNVFGAHFSNKSFIYLVGVQVNNTIKCLFIQFFLYSRIFFLDAKVTRLLFFVAFTIFLEKIHVTWYLWHNCWFLVSVEHLGFSNWESASHSQAPRRTSPSLGRQARSYQAPLPSSIEPSEEAIVVFVSIACIYDLLLSFMYLLTKHKNKIATPVNLKPRRASCHFTTCVRRRGKEGVFSGFQDSRPSVQESLLHTSYPCPLEWPKRRKTYYAVCVFYNYVLLCMVLL
ncbi:unnamed protein product, partial [Brassica oleracea]